MIVRYGIFGVLIAAFIGMMVFAYSILSQPKPVVRAPAPAAPRVVYAPPPATEQILTAAAALPGGSLITPVNIGSTSIPVSAQVPGELIDTAPNRSALVGSLLRVPLTPGAPIMDNEVIRPGDHGFLAAVLAPGMKAITLPVDNITGQSGLIWPGDYVDVLMDQQVVTQVTAPSQPNITITSSNGSSLSVPAPGSTAPVRQTENRVAVVVLADARVVATGSQLAKDPSTGAGNGSVATVTLQVTSEQAARCVVASDLGRLYMIVHSAQGSPKHDSSQPIPAPVYESEVSQASSQATVNVITSDGAKQGYNF